MFRWIRYNCFELIVVGAILLFFAAIGQALVRNGDPKHRAQARFAHDQRVAREDSVYRAEYQRLVEEVKR